MKNLQYFLSTGSDHTHTQMISSKYLPKQSIQK